MISMRNIIYYIAKHYDKLKHYPKQKRWKDVLAKEKIISKFLANVFKNDRAEFLNTYTDKLQYGRIKHSLIQYFDSQNISYQEQIERYFLDGWYYGQEKLNDGSLYEALYTHNRNYSTKGCTTKDSLKYAKFLTEKYGVGLFENSKVVRI